MKVKGTEPISVNSLLIETEKKEIKENNKNQKTQAVNVINPKQINKQAENLLKRHLKLKEAQSKITSLQKASSDIKELTKLLEDDSLKQESDPKVIVSRLLSILGQAKGIISASLKGSGQEAELKKLISDYTRKVLQMASTGEISDDVVKGVKALFATAGKVLDNQIEKEASLVEQMFGTKSMPSFDLSPFELMGIHKLDVNQLTKLI